MQRLIYSADIDDDICGLDGLHSLLNEIVAAGTGCEILRSRLESPDEINEIGVWEEEK